VTKIFATHHIMKERLLKIIAHYGMSVRAFEAHCELMRGNISNMSDDSSIGSDKLSKILDKFPDINSGWLLTGHGLMLIDSSKASPIITQEQQGEREALLMLLLKEKEEENKRLNKEIWELEQKVSFLKKHHQDADQPLVSSHELKKK
jgi:hypothetical protein